MNENIKAIFEKYGENIFRLGVTHLFSVGVTNLKDIEVDSVCDEMIKTTPENSIMTGEFRAEVLRCSVELAKEPLWEVLQYIQTNIGIDGVTVHPGIILHFRRNACMDEIMTCVVPSDTSEETLDNVIDSIEGKLEKYEKEHGSCYGFSYSNAIYDAFKDVNIRPESIPIDKTYYV